MEEILSKLRVSTKDHTIQISGNYKAKADLREELCKLLKLPTDTRFDSITFTSIIPDTPFYHKAIKYLSLCLDVPKEDPDPESVIEFHADWIRKDLNPVCSVEKFTQCQRDISYPRGAFLIDIFCSNQPKEFRHQYMKNFLMKKTILNLNLIAPLPVAFEYIQQTQSLKLSFADTQTITAQQISNQVNLALNLFNTIKPFSVRFQNICPYFYNFDFFDKISNENNCVFLTNPLGTDPNTKLFSFDMIVFPSRPGKDYRDNLIEKFKEIFNKYFFAKHCDRCSRFFTEIGCPNDECGVYEHEGNQIPFDDGKMEHTETMEDGSTITLVKYECCGEVIKDSIPQEYMKFGDFHIPEDPQKIYSAFNCQITQI